MSKRLAIGWACLVLVSAAGCKESSAKAGADDKSAASSDKGGTSKDTTAAATDSNADRFCDSFLRSVVSDEAPSEAKAALAMLQPDCLKAYATTKKKSPKDFGVCSDCVIAAKGKEAAVEKCVDEKEECASMDAFMDEMDALDPDNAPKPSKKKK